MSRDETSQNDELNTEAMSEEIDNPEVTPGDNSHSDVDGQAQAPVSDQEDTLSLDVQLQRAESRAEEYLDSLQRERASFQNYKKRVERERVEQRQRVASEVLLKLLPVLDDFYRAMDAVPQNERDDWYNGVMMIQRKLERYLESQGVTEIKALGEEFDPRFHEAAGVDMDSDAESGTVTDVLLRGYMHGDDVLRPAMVRVAG